MRPTAHPHATRACPRCHDTLNRMHRRPRDHAASTLLTGLTLRRYELRRYACSNCSWQGVRIARRRAAGYA